MKHRWKAVMAVAVLAMPAWSGADDRAPKGDATQERMAGAESDLEELLAEFANTPKEHQALARYFHAKAAEHRSLAAHHDAMAKSYGGGKLQTAAQMRQHCEKIAENERSLAGLYDDLAQDHEQEASRSK